MATTDNVLTSRSRLSATPAEVYRALTDPDVLRRWLAEHVDVSIPDGRFAFWGRGTPEREPGRQRLLEVEDDRRIKLGWQLDGDETTAELVLEADEPGNTVLTLTQTGVPSWAEMSPSADIRVSIVLFWGVAVANLADHIEGREPVPLCDFGPDRSVEATATITIAAPPETVFPSLLEPKQLERWGGWDAEVEPRVGGTFVLNSGSEPGKILELDFPRALSYTVVPGQVVHWELSGSEGRTYLSMVHSGFDDPAAAAQQEVGWVSALLELRRLHELGPAWRPVSIDFSIA